jgi:ferredoxin-like protein FixX
LNPSQLDEKFSSGGHQFWKNNPVQYFVNVDDTVVGSLEEILDSSNDKGMESMSSTIEEDDSDNEITVEESDPYSDSDDEEEDKEYEPPIATEACLDANNYIQDFTAIKIAIENNLECLCCRMEDALEMVNKLTSKGRKKMVKSFCMLQLDISRHGFATDVNIKCTVCEFSVEANLTDIKDDYEGKSSFLKYGINYKAVLLMQHLGIGPEGLGQVLGFLSISPGTSNDKKWKDIQDSVGQAQEKICEAVIEENIAEEVQCTKEEATKDYEVWENSALGMTTNEESKARKKDELFKMHRNSQVWDHCWHGWCMAEER